jgi:hypothetical protein
MKNFNNANITLFESTIACFKLSVEALFTRKRQDGSVGNLVYVTDKGTAVLNPSIYLVFTYKGDTYENTKTLYTSYPQLFRIREAMEEVKQLVHNKKGFVEVEGVLMVRPENQSPVSVGEIGKSKKSISFMLNTIDSGEEGMPAKIPGVTIQLSDSEFASVLTVEEFLTIYSIVMNLDLTTIQVQLSSLFLQSEGGVAPVYGQPMYQQPYQPQYQPQPAPQQQPYQPRQSYTQPQSAPQQARYGSAPMKQNRTMTGSKPQPAPATQEAPQGQATTRQQTNQGLQPRAQEKNIVNLKSVEETQVSQVSFDDSAAINDIFGEE